MKKINKTTVFIMTLILSLLVIPIAGQKVYAAGGNISSLPVSIKAYPVSTANNTPAFANKGDGNKSGTIYAADLCTITRIDGDGWLIVNYPTSNNRTRTLFVKARDFFCATSFQEASISKYATAYRRSSGSESIGSVDSADNLVYVIGSPQNNRSQIVYKVTNSNYYKMGWVRTDAIRFQSTSYNPQGCFDSVVSNAANQITVRGWAFDKDNTSKAIDVHVYVGGPAGSGYGVSLTANTSRPDVHKVFGCGNNHGFDRTYSLPAKYAGTTQTVYVYAINIGGGSNQLIGTKTVTIKGKAVSDNNFIKEDNLKTAAANYGIDTNSNAYEALKLINTKYASQLSAAQKQGTIVLMFEGVGTSSSPSKRENAMCVVVKNGTIGYINRSSSRLPDYPFTPSKNGGTPMPTLKSGTYTFTTVNHRQQYAALNVSGASVVRFRSSNSWYSDTSPAINIHRKSSDSIAGANQSWVNSAGCQLVGRTGTDKSSDYAKFIQSVGIVNANAAGNVGYTYSVTGIYIVDRSYAYQYMRNIGYSDAAIRAIG